MWCFVELMLRTNRTSAVAPKERTISLFLTPSTRIKGGLILVDEKYAALAEGHSELSLECVLHFLASLLDIAVHLIDVAFGLKLTVTSRLSDRLFDLAFGYLSHVLGLVLFAHYRSMSR
jgi:hypothetical protein